MSLHDRMDNLIYSYPQSPSTFGEVSMPDAIAITTAFNMTQ